MTTRAAVITEARTWLGTPYHDLGRIKGVGCDCAQMPAAVYHACGLIPDLRPVYSPQWFLHHSEEKYLAWVRPYAREIDADQVLPGDFLIWKWANTFSHGAIVVSETNVIHAQKPWGVIETNWREHSDLSNSDAHPVKAFTLWSE